jgi:hypothetical protein
MKNSIYSLVFLACASSFGFTKIELNCAPSVVKPDQGFSTVISYRSPQIGQKEGHYSATASEQTIAGPRNVIVNRPVRKVVTPHVMGAPVRYIGTEYELSVNFTVTPRPDHKHLGQLKAVSDEGREITEEVLCVLN